MGSWQGQSSNLRQLFLSGDTTGGLGLGDVEGLREPPVERGLVCGEQLQVPGHGHPPPVLPGLGDNELPGFLVDREGLESMSGPALVAVRSARQAGCSKVTSSLVVSRVARRGAAVGVSLRGGGSA